MAKTTVPIELSSTPSIVDNGNATAITIDSSQNVGIGTSSPSTILEIASGNSGGDAALDSPTFRINNTTDSADWDVGDVVGTIEYYSSDASGNAPYTASFIKSVNEQGNGTLPSGALTFGTAAYNASGGAIERMRIDSSGNVVIGSGGLDVSGIGGTYTALNMRAGGGYPVLYGQTTATTTNSAAMQIVGATSGASAGGAAEMLGVIQIAVESDSSTNGTGYINFYTGSGGSVTERMRIDSSGFLQIATTGKTGRINLQPNPSNNHFVEFYTTADGKVGEINTTGGTTTNYVTSSDYRLKENVEYDWDATTRLKQLKPARFNFIADANTTVDGFLAHEVSSIVPEAIHGEKDAVDDEGNPKYQGIDQSKLVPLLVKTIQELEARITALEGN